MSGIISVAGKVSGVRLDTSVSVSNTTTVNNYGDSGYSAPSTTTSSQTVVNKNMTFRINNTAANMPVAVNLTDGDLVTAAGFQKGELKVIALHNHTTRLLYTVPKANNTVGAIIDIVIGVFTINFYGLGYFLIGLGIWLLVSATKKNMQIAEASRLVEKAPVPG